MLQFVLVERFFKIIRSSRLRWFLNRHFPRAFFLPRMTRKEFALFSELAGARRVVVEYGSGGSTIWFLRKGKRIFSVDSNPGFHQLMTALPFVHNAVGSTLNLDFVDMGPTDTWGTPLSKDKRDQWPNYVSQPWTRAEAAGAAVDLVLVDGRFRVACCLYSIRELVERGRSTSLILMHDFWDRKEYHVVLPFLEEHKSAGTLAAFRPKADVDLSALTRLLEEYSGVPR